MPSGKDFFDKVQARFARKVSEKRQRGERYAGLLPEDFTGQVFLAAREEARRIWDRIDWIEGELETVGGELAAAKAAALKACPEIVPRDRVRGDILSDFEMVTPPRRGARIKTAAAVKFHNETVRPLQRYEAALQRELSGRQQELAELRKIATLTSEGEVTLIHFLSDAWRSRLEIGRGLAGRLPPEARALFDRHVIYVDSSGSPLPPEALDAEGKPDLPDRKVPRE